MAKKTYGKISKVIDKSPAAKAGLLPGDELLAIDEEPVCDILNYQYLTAEEEFTLDIRREGQVYECAITKDEAEDLGIEFEEELFDGVRSCRNNCIFCFLHQMPKGLRQSLYVRDDDFRLSFAHGNYITLTNLGDEEMDRICTQRMSPLYISVHTTEPDLRVRMMRNENAGRIMDQLKAFAKARITMHTQIVLCPGVNDGEHLERTICDLSSLHPWVASIAVVPVGLTKHRERLTPLVRANSETAHKVLEACMRWQEDFKSRLGTRLVFPSDEFYLLSGTEFPPSEDYEGFPQLEDGIGVSRIFLDELDELSKEELRVRPGKYVLVTGTLATPMVQQFADLLDGVGGVSARVCTVVNKFLGESVTVAGLLTGQDIADALFEASDDEKVILPNIVLNEDRFLDGMTLSQLRECVDAQIITVAPSPCAVIECLRKT